MKKALSVCMAALLSLALLAGCAPTITATDSSTDADAIKSATIEAETSDDKVTLDESTSTEADDSLKGKVIGISMMDMRQQYFVSLVQGMIDQAEVYGFELNIQDQSNDGSKQYEQMENFVSMGVDGIILCAIDQAGAVTSVANAHEKGIPVVTSAISVDGQDALVSWIHYDYGFTVGKMAGEWITETYGEEGCAVGVIGFDLTVDQRDRTQGIVDGLAKYAPNAQVVAIENSESYEQSVKVTENMMSEHPEIRVIAAIDDDNGGLGANEVLCSLIPLENRDKYGVFAADAVPQAIERMQDDTSCYRGTIDLHTYQQGVSCIDTIAKLLKGEEVPSFVLVASDDEVTKDRAKSEY